MGSFGSNNPLNFFTSNPIGLAITGIVSAFDQMINFRKAEERNAENERQIREILGGRIEGGELRNRTFGRLQNEEAIRVRDNMDRILRSRTREGREIIRGVGEQTRQDLRRSFGNQASAAQAQLGGSGLSGTPIGIGIGAGFTTAHADARRRLDEGLATQQFNAFTGLTGDRLRALQANEENVLDTRERSFNRMLNTFLSTTGDAANFINSINAPHPDNNALVQRLGAVAVDPPQRSSRELFVPATIGVASDLLSAPGESLGAFGQGISDERLKRNIEPIGFPIRGIQPVLFYWRTEEFPTLPDGQHAGVIAQQVRVRYPNAVLETAHGYLVVDYELLFLECPTLTGILTEALAEHANAHHAT